MINPAEWDADRYDRISAPQVVWGERVLARLPLRGGEIVMDAGCGTGRLTARLLEKMSDGKIVAVDLSENMLRVAKRILEPQFGEKVSLVHADCAELPFERDFDGIFSTAVFHWVTDHRRLFSSLYKSLKPGGWLVAQCGEAGNYARLRRRAQTLASTRAFARYFEGWKEDVEYATAEATAQRMIETGFTDVLTSAEPTPTDFAGAEAYAEFLETVVLRLYLNRLPNENLQTSFINALVEEAALDDIPFRLDSCRLNISGRRPA